MVSKTTKPSATEPAILGETPSHLRARFTMFPSPESVSLRGGVGGGGVGAADAHTPNAMSLRPEAGGNENGEA